MPQIIVQTWRNCYQECSIENGRRCTFILERLVWAQVSDLCQRENIYYTKWKYIL